MRTNLRGTRPLDAIAAALATLFAMAMVVTPPPNLDLWWLLAVGRRMVETHAYIYSDPFTFTVAGAPWSPQSWGSALVYYGLFQAGGMAAIGVLRVLLAGVIAALSLRAIRAANVGWAIASPLVMLALLTAHTRFADRGQLFEYAFVAWLLGFLLTAHARRGRGFFAWPLVVQLAWVQLHSSFLLGPALAAVFFAGEWVSERLTRPLARHDYRRAALLVALMALACVVNPNPKAFLIQPFDAAQRELITRFTLEWKSPFDPAVASADFHPFYEVLLGAAALAILLSLPRVPLAPAALLAVTALLSFQSHRFRVEFALVAAVMVPVLLRGSSIVARLARRPNAARAWASAGLALALALALLEHERLERRPTPELLPGRALAFVAEHDVAHRPFHPIGFGSYMLWDLYGERATFIDGRNFDAALYEDFLRGQTNAPALRAVVKKYAVDSFIIPAPARADAGMRNVHNSLIVWNATWDLVHMDPTAFVYVARAAADSTWLAAHAYRAYHPLTFAKTRHTPEAFALAIADLERLTRASPEFVPGWLDLALARLARGEDAAAAAALERVLALDPAHAGARDLMRRLQAPR